MLSIAPRLAPVPRGPAARASRALAVLGLLAALAGCRARGPAAGGGPEAPGAAARNPFAADRLWDDGKAEVNAYDATVRRYDVLRPFTAYHIVVKEDFSKAQLVKADSGHDPGDLVTVLKLNQVLHFQTGIYAYHQMASTFYDRASMDLLKFSLTSFEWCGNSYKEYTRRGDKAALHVHTYWDGEAEATYDLPVGPDVVLYDQMPLWIRALPQTAGTARRLRVVAGQIGSKGPRPEIDPGILRAVAEETVPTPAGAFQALRWELEVAGRDPDLYWTARGFPYLLVAWDKPDGGSYRLRWTQRLPYWKLNHPGGEKYLLGPAGAPR